MVRAVLLGALIAVTPLAIACSNDKPATQADPNAPAGTVVDIAGTVMVGPKPLAKGDSVAAGDIVDTGADGAVAIVLAHNHVRWELGPNKHVRASESLAWSQPTAGGSAVAVDQDSSAAGRPGERAAAQSSTSSSAGSAPPERIVAPAPAPMPAPGAAGDASAPAMGVIGNGKGAGHAVTRSPARSMQPVAPLPPADAPPPPPAPPAPQGAKAKPPASLTNAAADESSALTKCLAVGQSVSIVIHVKSGAGDVTFSGAVDDKLKSCVATEVRAHKWPDVVGDVSLQITR